MSTNNFITKSNFDLESPFASGDACSVSNATITLATPKANGDSDKEISTVETACVVRMSISLDISKKEMLSVANALFAAII